MTLGRFDEALKHFHELANLYPDQAGPQQRICDCLREMGRPEDAIAACEKADEFER